MFFLSRQTVCANGLQLVNRNRIPMVSEGRNHGILAHITTLQSITSENNIVREVGWMRWMENQNLFPVSFLLLPQCT